MPIYAYRCDDCGHAQDFLQKMSDALIDTCPACGSKMFPKQLTAAGFQLKGGGWYVTDFRDGGKKDAKKPGEGGTDGKAGESAAASEGKSDVKSEGKSEGKSDGKSEGKSEGKSAGKSDGKPSEGAKPAATSTPATPTTPAPSSGGATKAA